MRIGTKSVLFGAHCFFLHPWFVAWAWWKLYSFPWDPRLWVAFFVHDLGYWGMQNMDGDDEGELHPYFGAIIMRNLFDRTGSYWFKFTLYHSRFLAKKLNEQFSPLCVADKLAICLTPAWLYLPLVNLTGEIKEYMATSIQHSNTKHAFMNLDQTSQKLWHTSMVKYLLSWVEEHKEGKQDNWTSISSKKDPNPSVNGVWQ